MEGAIRILGFVLIAAGMLALATGGFSYSRRRDTVQVGPLRASIQEKERVSIPPLLSAAVLLAGVACVVVGFRRRK